METLMVQTAPKIKKRTGVHTLLVDSARKRHCENCQSKSSKDGWSLLVHHIDEDIDNNHSNNLMTL